MRFRSLFPTRVALAIALFVCIVAPITLVTLQIDANPKFSPVDEAAHFDYVNRVAAGEMPRQGQRLQESTLREVACKGNALETVEAPPCATRDLRYEQFGGGAYQYEALHPPTYYAITVPLRWVARNVLRIRDTLDATRAAGVVWLVTGLLLLWAAGRVMDIHPTRLGPALLLLVVAPTVIYFHGTVSTDATAVAAAGVVALAAALAYRRDGPRVPIMLFAAGSFAAACKVTNLFPVVALSALFAVAAITRHASGEPWTASLRRWLRDGGALLAGGVGTAVLWVIVHRSISLIALTEDPTLDALRGGQQTFARVLFVAGTFLEPITGELAVALVSGDTLRQDVQKPLHVALSFVLVGAGLAGMFVSPRRWYHVLGLIAVPALYVGGVVLGLGFMIGFGTDAGAGVSGRYGMSMAPLLLLALAASLQGKWSVGAVAAFAAVSFVTTLAVMAT